MLNLGGIVADDFVLSDRNIAARAAAHAQPQRHDHASMRCGPAQARPGASPTCVASACMKDCGSAPQVASFLPDFARDAHGNLAEQNRPVGAQRGADTSKPQRGARSARAARAAAAARLRPRRRRVVADNGGSTRRLHWRESTPASPAMASTASWSGRAFGGRQKACGSRRRGRLPGRQDQRRRLGRVGRHADAAAVACARPMQGDRALAGRRREAVAAVASQGMSPNARPNRFIRICE